MNIYLTVLPLLSRDEASVFFWASESHTNCRMLNQVSVTVLFIEIEFAMEWPDGHDSLLIQLAKTNILSNAICRPSQKDPAN